MNDLKEHKTEQIAFNIFIVEYGILFQASLSFTGFLILMTIYVKFLFGN